MYMQLKRCEQQNLCTHTHLRRTKRKRSDADSHSFNGKCLKKFGRSVCVLAWLVNGQRMVNDSILHTETPISEGTETTTKCRMGKRRKECLSLVKCIGSPAETDE